MADIFGTNNPGFIFNPFTDAEMVALLNLSTLGDPNADRILFWDDSAGAYAYLTAGSGLNITGTTLTATGATLADGDYGDIVVSGSGTVITIDTGVVTLAKMANVATGTVFYRKTAGTGAPEVQTLATLKTDLGLTGTNSGDQTSVTGNAGTATALQTGRTIGIVTGDATSAGSSFDGTANNTNALTLATVNSNVGSFTNANITVDAKGRITAASNGSSGGGVATVASADGSITVTGTTAIDLAVVKAPKWTTARNLAGNSVDGSANVAFANKFIVQGTTDAGLSGAQFLGALGTGLVKNTTTTGVLSIATSGTDYEVPLTFSTGLTRSTNTITVNTSQNIATLSNLTSNGLVTTSGSAGTLGITVPATGILTFLTTPSSANLIAAVTDETGTGALVFANTPSLVTPAIAGGALSGTFSGTPTFSGSTITFSATAATLVLGAQGTGSTTTPTLLDMGGSFADTITSSKAKWKLYNDGTTINTYGIGITSGQFNFFKLTGGGYYWYFSDVEKMNLSSTGALTIQSGLTAGGASGIGNNAFTCGTVEIGFSTDTTLSRSSAGVLAVEGVVIPSISSTNTLTNKRVTKRAPATTQSATPTINTDVTDVVHITALAQAITSMTTNLTGTPVEGDTLRIDITDNGTARAITWGASFESSGTVTLPSTTVVSTRLDIGFFWNTATSKWRCVAVA